MTERITVEMTDGVADVRLDRGDKMNAMDADMFAALIDTANELAEMPGLRAVVLSGNGPSWCAGLDFSMFEQMASANAAGGGAIVGEDADPSSIGAMVEGRITHRAQQAVWGWRELPVPVIAAVHGVAFGAGFQLAVACDIRIVHPEARMSVLEIRWGITPDMTCTHLLPGIVGADVAKELVWTGREVLGKEAVRIGLATRLSEDPHAAAMELATTIAGKSPDAIRAGKRLIETAYAEDFAAGFATERDEIGALIGTPNQVESIAAYFEKRPANYTDPSSDR